jgi:DNA repair protein RadD
MYQLRDYQRTAVANVVKFFKKSQAPAAVVLPTGAGKSLVIAELARIAKGRVLVLAHVKELVEQNHEKYVSYGLAAGIFSASLGKKDWQQKAIFGSVQSIARAPDEFFADFSLLVIDECHRVADDSDTQYQEVIRKLTARNPGLCILGLTATPYRLGLGWIYEVAQTGERKTEQPRFFKQCVFELPLMYMIKHRYLTVPIKVDIPVTSYDFSELSETGRMYTAAEVEEILKSQKRLTPLIINNIIDITERYHRKGVIQRLGAARGGDPLVPAGGAGEAGGGRHRPGRTRPDNRGFQRQEVQIPGQRLSAHYGVRCASCRRDRDLAPD